MSNSEGVLELPFCRLNEPSEGSAARVIEIVFRADDWMSCNEILTALALPKTESNKRQIRLSAEAAGNELISGQKGYKHIENATPDEVHHFCSWMENQATKMKLRAAKTRARAHQLVG